MSHWLDDLGRGLAEGTHSRREVLRRAGLAAAGAVVAAVVPASKAWSAVPALKGVPCPDFDSPCLHPDVCCGGSHCCDSTTETCCGGRCISNSLHLGCCHDGTYDPSTERCCPQGAAGHACFKDETCCGTTACCKADETCCGGRCISNSLHLGCCHDGTYDPSTERCCPQGAAGHACFKDETCCGTTACCKKGEECCGSGDSTYCAPKGKCHAECTSDQMKCGSQCCKPFQTTLIGFGVSPPTSVIVPSGTAGPHENVCIIYQTGGSASHPVTDGFCVSTCSPNDLVIETFGKLGKPTTLCCPPGKVAIDCYRSEQRLKKPIVCVSPASAVQFASTYCPGWSA